MAAVARLYAVLAEIGSKARFLAMPPANGPAGRGLDWARLEKLLPDEGLPRDAVVEVASVRALGGGTGVAIRAVRAALAKDAAAFAAWVDPFGALHAPGVARAGVDLRRLLMVRPPSLQDVGRAAVKVVASGAFEIVVVDMASLEELPPQPQKGKRGRRPLPPEVMVRKLALLAEKRGTTVVLLSDSTQPRALPWPVALRLELAQRPHELSVRVAKDRRGRVAASPTWIPLDETEEDLAPVPPRTARRNRRRPRGMGAAAQPIASEVQPASTPRVPKYELAPNPAASPEPNRSKRFVAVAFSQLRIEIARSHATDTAGPLAVVLAHPNGSVRDEASLLGNTRIDDVSDEARALGILPGFTVAAARARSQALAVRVVSAAAVEHALARVAEMALAFGRSTAFIAEEDMVFVDVTGCEHLHACEGDPSGARTLASRLQECILELGHVARIAVACGPRMAAAFARRALANAAPILDTDDEAFARLPIDALPLDADTLDWLAKLGLSTIADLRALPPSELGPRLPSPCARDIMALLRGEDETPIAPYQPPEEPEECAELEYGLETNESLLFVVKGLCERLSARLMGRTRCTTHLELVLRLDRALLSDADSPRVALPMRLAAPIRTPAELMAVLRAKVESYTLAAPILAVSLRATKLVPYEFHARDLFVPEARAEAELPRLVAELGADLGDARVGMFELENRWIPEQRAPKLVPFAGFPLSERCASDESRLVSRAIEPVRILSRPIPYTGPVPRDSFLARNEAQEWWRAPKLPQPGSGHDDLAIFLPELGAVAWVVRDRQTKRMLIRGYIEHA
ncbi:hypothetical protein LVJ94_16245 [Pendulispora rubella]|uniref:UmuC domain-containing protein n=1 Tax=Pendulispora rubella TaxID=2741070 RepID=A0ABZ2LCW9_9BACT